MARGLEGGHPPQTTADFIESRIWPVRRRFSHASKRQFNAAQIGSVVTLYRQQRAPSKRRIAPVMRTAKLKCGIAKAFHAGDRETCEMLVDELYNLLDEQWAVQSAWVAAARAEPARAALSHLP